MKKTYAFLATLLLASGVAAQNPTAYFMEGTTFRSQFNPAFAPLRGYVNIPGLGGIDINASGNLAVDKLLYPYFANLPNEKTTILMGMQKVDAGTFSMTAKSAIGL